MTNGNRYATASQAPNNGVLGTQVSRSTAALVALGVLALVAVGFFFDAIGYYNRCVSAENGLKQEQREAMNRHSQMVTTIMEVAGVNNQYRRDIERAFDRVVQARQGGTSEVMRAIAEANPSINTATYERVQRVIEERRTEFANVQTSLLDRRREYDTYRQQMPGAMYNAVFHFPRTDLDAVTRILVTQATEDAYRTGHDAPLNLGN